MPLNRTVFSIIGNDLASLYCYLKQLSYVLALGLCFSTGDNSLDRFLCWHN